MLPVKGENEDRHSGSKREKGLEKDSLCLRDLLPVGHDYICTFVCARNVWFLCVCVWVHVCVCLCACARVCLAWQKATLPNCKRISDLKKGSLHLIEGLRAARKKSKRWKWGYNPAQNILSRRRSLKCLLCFLHLSLLPAFLSTSETRVILYRPNLCSPSLKTFTGFRNILISSLWWRKVPQLLLQRCDLWSLWTSVPPVHWIKERDIGNVAQPLLAWRIFIDRGKEI